MKGFLRNCRGISLPEVLIVVVLMLILAAAGIPAYFGLMKASRDKDAISHAYTLNQAQQTYKWRVANAGANWSAATDDSARYAFLSAYIPMNSSYPSLSSFQPDGYTFAFGATLDTKVSITGPDGIVSY